jgi:hypothetical protein
LADAELAATLISAAILSSLNIITQVINQVTDIKMKLNESIIAAYLYRFDNGVLYNVYATGDAVCGIQ